MTGILTVTFSAGNEGQWEMQRILPVIGDVLPMAKRLSITTNATTASEADWRLKGVVSNPRYSQAAEMKMMKPVSEGLMRPEAIYGALIPIKKSDAWWMMAQDERRHIFEESSGHIAKSMKYLPAIARRLHHSRDLGESFDFVTWFEFAPKYEAEFDQLLAELRATQEWKFVDREVDIRLTRPA